MKYTFKRVTIPANTEYVEAILTSTAEEPKRIVSLHFEKNTNLDFRAYIERERIVDFDSDLLPDNKPYLEVGIDLPVGQTLKVGAYNNSGSSVTVAIGVAYELSV